MRKAAGTFTPVSDQLAADVVAQLNAARQAQEALQRAHQEAAFAHALEEMGKVRTFILNPEGILGRMDTKHGEVAEQVEVGIRRAQAALNQATPDATFEGVDRFAPMDYRIDGVDVQSKFVGGVVKGLEHVRQHLEKYPGFGNDGAYYHIPKDQHAEIVKVLQGQTEGMSSKTVAAIQAKVQDIEATTGRPFGQVVRPALSGYDDVQLGKVEETLDRHEARLAQRQEQKQTQIADKHGPTLGEGVTAALGGAAVGAAVGFAGAAWGKYREGKNVFKGDFTEADWKEVGGDAFQGALLGGVSAAALYALTNCADMAAPFAGAVVSAVKGLAPLVADYRAGRITLEALIDNGLLVCGDAAIVGLCTVLGQTLIPVPYVGALLGSLAGKVLSGFLRQEIEGVATQLEKRMAAQLAALGEDFRAMSARLTGEFDRLGKLTEAAFTVSTNQQLLQASLDLAQAHGVPESRLLRNQQDVLGLLQGRRALLALPG